MPNKLINEKSPYLLSHAKNPVNWYPWGDEAFTEAKKRDLPIFLSIGYSSCHWCHVMERECFVDVEVADILNSNFISIKVDREERTDIDHFYMEACVAFSRSGGWPLSAFLNHDKVPFFAGTYFPKNDGLYGTGFITILNNISSIWKHNREKITESGNELLNYFQKSDKTIKSEYEINIDELYQKSQRIFDMVNGGIMGAPKFPSCPTLSFLLEYNKLNPNHNATKILNKTLNAMATGGIFDHIGGGFFRYSTDVKWLVPHFEKMLYDNAQLLLIYSIASATIDKKFEAAARKTAEYLFRDMKNNEGGFFTAQDADSEGVEGKYYLFTPNEIKKALGESEGSIFCNDYDITLKGNFEGFNIPNRIGKDFLENDERMVRLLEYRSKRIPPLLDDKIITSSNSLMVIALTISGKILNEPLWIEEATKTADFLLNNLFKDNRLYARYKDNDTAHKATLDDYGLLILALLELYMASFNIKWLKKAMDIAESAINLFSDIKGGFYLSGTDVTDLPLRMKNYRDSATPSGNAIIAKCFFVLYEITKKEDYKKQLELIQLSYKDLIKNDAYSYYSFLSGLILSENFKTLAITKGKNLKDFMNYLQGYQPFFITFLIDKDFISLLKKYNIDTSLIENQNQDKTTIQPCDSKQCYPLINTTEELVKFLN